MLRQVASHALSAPVAKRALASMRAPRYRGCCVAGRRVSGRVDAAWQARERFGARLLLVNRSVVHSGMQQMQDGSGRARKADDFAKVMADWWLMGEMDELVGTASCHTTHPKGCMGGSRSSFGVTAAWRRCVPVVLLPADAADAACLGNARTAVGAAWSVEVA